MGYHVRRDRQNQGFATEAATAAKAFAADHGIERLIAIINPENLPSQRVTEKIGLATNGLHLTRMATRGSTPPR